MYESELNPAVSQSGHEYRRTSMEDSQVETEVKMELTWAKI